MKLLDGTALINVPKILGVPQPDSRERIEFDDLIVQQHLDITGIAGRGVTTELGDRGIAAVALANVHVGAGGLSQTFDPYSVIAAGVSWFPLDQARLFDVYLLGPITAVTTVADTVAGAMLDIFHGVSLNDGSIPAPQRIALFDDDVDVPGMGLFLKEPGIAGRVQVDTLAHRIVPGAPIRWTSEVTAAASITVTFTLLVTAIGIPQDAR